MMAEIIPRKSGDRKIQDALWYPLLPIREKQEIRSVCVPKTLIKNYTDENLRTVSHSVRDRLESLKEDIVRTKKVKKAEGMRLVELEYDPDLNKRAEWSLKKLKKQMRGRTSDQISNLLLKDLSEQTTEQHATEEVKTMRTSRRQYHVEMMDDRTTKQLDECIVEPLHALQSQLKGYGRKESMYLQNKRCCQIRLYLDVLKISLIQVR